MTGPEHYLQAQRLLIEADQAEDVLRQGSGAPANPHSLRQAAAVHATLAQTAAIATGTMNRTEWIRATLTVPEDPPRVHDTHGGPGEDCWCGYVGHS